MYRAMGHALGADLMERYEFDCEGDGLVGNLHLPQGDAHGVAILTGPLTSVKEQATGAWADDGIVQQALRALKKSSASKKLVLMADVCL